MGIKLQFKGFDEMIEQLNAVEKDLKPIINDLAEEVAKIEDRQLKAEMMASGVAADLISRMPPPTVEWEGDTCRAKAGYKMGSYNPADPSDGFKAVFINYGTPRITPRNFVEPAKKTVQKAVRKYAKKTLSEIVGGLKK